MRPASVRGPVWVFAVVVAAGGCAARMAAEPDLPISTPSKVCANKALSDKAFCLPKQAEAMLRTGKFDILQVQKPKSGLGGAVSLVMRYPEEHLEIKAKWKTSHQGGSGFNNQPRKELAAYKMQSLFLAQEDYVVPPTVGRCIPTETFRASVQLKEAPETFEGAHCIFGVLSYWLTNVTSDGVFDRDRFDRDRAYRQSVANLNLLTYLIDHRDTRPSNFLISTDPDHPNVFAVDNGLAFSGFRNPLAWFTKQDWSNIIVPSLPRKQVDRLRKVTRRELDALLTVAQYSVKPSGLEEVAPTAAFSDASGVRRKGDVIQLGLTRGEVDGIASRLKKLLERVDRGKVETF